MVELDFFLWPMLLPLIIPILYCIKNKVTPCVEILLVAFSMIVIVIFYWPLTLAIPTPANIITKFILFMLLPLIILTTGLKIKKDIKEKLELIGLSRKNIKKSFMLGLFFLPIMLLITALVQFGIGFSSNDPNLFLGVMSFFESFTEEFFFRGILFLLLMSKTNFKIAYSTSLACFILAHPQNITSIFIISTIVQGLITLEICRRTRNLIGPWVVHGTNRIFSIAIIPFLF